MNNTNYLNEVKKDINIIFGEASKAMKIAKQELDSWGIREANQARFRKDEMVLIKDGEVEYNYNGAYGLSSEESQEAYAIYENVRKANQAYKNAKYDLDALKNYGGDISGYVMSRKLENLYKISSRQADQLVAQLQVRPMSDNHFTTMPTLERRAYHNNKKGNWAIELRSDLITNDSWRLENLKYQFGGMIEDAKMFILEDVALVGRIENLKAQTRTQFRAIQGGNK